tara:strand:+ start:445 stop:756 length:312 start_codon:yes stop_codon:yes gene_type:complete
VNRYKKIRLEIDNITGQRYKKTTQYPIIQNRDSDIIYYSKIGDTYNNLAHKFYGDTTLWWIIQLANNQNALGKIGIPVATRLVIPQHTNEIIDDLNKLNSIVD